MKAEESKSENTLVKEDLQLVVSLLAADEESPVMLVSKKKRLRPF